VVDEIKQLLPQLSATLPAGIHTAVISDRTTTIRASVADVQKELLLTIVFVVLVLFVFLRTFSATVIPSVAVPLSLIGTLGIMYLLGYSLDNLSLMALTISTGFVVDDAIVMIENIERYIEEGDAPLASALKGSEQIGFTILSLTVSLIAVLIPLLFMSDVVGRLFREFAVTLGATIVVSAIVSLTLTPMMCARLLRHRPAERASRFSRACERAFDAGLRWYDATLRRVLQHQTLTLIVAAATLVGTVLLYIYVPKGFFPVQDTGAILGISEASPSTTFSAMAARQQRLASIILQDPAVEGLTSFIGVDGTNLTRNTGRIQISLKPLESRDASAPDIIRRLQPKLDAVSGIQLYMQPVQDLTVEDRVSRTQYQYSLASVNAATLDTWVPQLVRRLQALPGLRDVASDQANGGTEAALTIDRDTAARLGVTPQAVDNVLYDAFGQRQVSTIFTQVNQYRVVLAANAPTSQEPWSLLDLRVPATVGGQSGLVPLGVLARLDERPTHLSVNRQDQFPAATVSFNLAPGESLGHAVETVRAATREIGLPASVEATFQGTTAAFERSLSNEALLVIAAIVTVYIVLGVLYESYIHPVTILSTLPSAGVGAIVALLLCRLELGVIALIGIVLLIGIVKKNAIMMIDFALDAERQEGKSPAEAIYQACLLRLRPIMMTTMAALLGAIPLAFSHGTGAELRRPLGITIVGGLLVSQLLTLYTTPVVYLAFERVASRWRGRTAEPGER
jgi:multidrug efflux pump